MRVFAMLHLYQSNRLETLGTLLATVQQAAPLSDPFAAETVLVQSRGMGRWITLDLAKKAGIAAHLDFVLPAAFAWQLMQKVLPGLPRKSTFAPEVLSWRLMALLPTLSGEPYQALARYLEGGETAVFELSGKVADIFDQYLVFRPQWIRAWERGELQGLGEDEAWQAALWRVLAAEDATRHRVRLLDDFLSSLTRAHLPERVILFGISNLAPMYLALVKRLSALTEVFLFTLNPCEAYWGDLVEARRQRDLFDTEAVAAAQGHPLLASLGKQGRDFFDLIAGDAELDSHPLYDAGEEGSLLSRLQRDMLTLANPGLGSYVPAVQAVDDRSIELHATHGAMRELEVLKDRLLARFAADSSLTPADIVVLTPDINAYAPFIDSVFGKRSDAGAANIPYTIADRTVAREQPLLASFAALLDLLDSRFAADDVLSLLDCDALLARFGLTATDVPFIHDWVRASGIRWGRDAAHKRALGLPDDAHHTWRWGLDRLLLGGILPEAMAGDTRSPLFGGLLPAGGAGGSLSETLARFASLIETLFELAELWQQAATPPLWATRLGEAANALFSVNAEEEDALAVLFDAAAELAEDATLAAYSQAVGLPVVRDYIQRRLKQASGSGFLAGRVTFCAMVPMRSIPFRVLCLIGMNDGAYPRDERPVSFDLIASHPQKGDRSRRFEDRYLFLEAILSAREALYLSWVGRSARSDEPLPPSALVSELLDCLCAMTGTDAGKSLLQQHSLQPFARSNYAATAEASFEPAYYAALSAPRHAPLPFATPLPLTAPRVVALSALIRFWQNPVRSYLSDQLGVRLAATLEDMETREPFALDRNSRVAVRTPLVAALYAGKPLAPVKARLSGMGLLPPAALGQAWLADELGQSARFAARLPDELADAPLPPEPLGLVIGDFTLAGELSGLRPCGLITTTPRRAHAGERIAFWLRHLVLCVLRPAGVMPASLLVDDEDALALLPVDDATAQLEAWLSFYALGQRAPLAFFPRTSLAAAKVLADDVTARDAALIKAYAEWDPSFTGRGKFPQKSEAAVELVFRGSEPLQDAQFLQLAQVLLLPMLAAFDGKEETEDAA